MYFCHSCRRVSHYANNQTMTCTHCNSAVLEFFRGNQIFTLRVPFSSVTTNQPPIVVPPGYRVLPVMYVPSNSGINSETFDNFFQGFCQSMRQSSPAEVQRRINAMKKRQFDPVKDETTCSICLESHCDTVAEVTCGHIFHLTCMETWLKQKNSCPLCQANVVN